MITAKFIGGKELEAALLDLPKKVGRPAVLNALKDSAKPLVEELRATAPRLTGKSAATITARSVKVPGFEESIAIGPTKEGFPLMLREFGTARQPARPWMRPRWDSHREAVLKRFAGDMRARIEKAAARYAAKMAKAAL